MDEPGNHNRLGRDGDHQQGRRASDSVYLQRLRRHRHKRQRLDAVGQWYGSDGGRYAALADTRAPTLSFEADTTVTTTVAIEPAGGSGTGLGGVVFSVTASEALENVSADDFVLSGTAYAVVNARFVSEPAASSRRRRRVLCGPHGRRPGRTYPPRPPAAVALVLGLAPGVDATDASGNTLTLAESLTLAPAATSEDTSTPFLLDVNLGKAALSAEGRVFEIEASETLVGVDAADFVLASGFVPASKNDSDGMLIPAMFTTATDFGLAGVTTTTRDRDGEDVFFLLVTVTLVDATATLSDESLRLGAADGLQYRGPQWQRLDAARRRVPPGRRGQ